MRSQDEFRRFAAENLPATGENPLRQEIERQTQEFLAAGGRINHIAPAVTGWEEGRYDMGFKLNLRKAGQLQHPRKRTRGL